ncbi:sulfatase-like hydrolase/transferase [Rubritalea tangerina]|uniref:Sulfatase-like hydrolase/transferase n=1 Tax=Rubritalea tangerina TaxID=430798 RepID=A0ABW4ZBI5_9BACT
MPYKLLHTLIWLCGIGYGLIPFVRQHRFGNAELSPYLGESYLGSHILISLSLAAAGATLWGGISRWLCTGDYKQHKAQTWMRTTLVGQLILLTLGATDLLSGFQYLLAGLLFCAVIIGCSIAFSHHPTPTRVEILQLRNWLTRPRPWNGPFFIALYALLLWHNYQLVNGMHSLDDTHKLSLFINRMFTQMALTGCLYFVVQLCIDTGPRWTRPWIWVIASTAPIAIVIDRLLHGYWNQTFLGFVNKLGTKGLLNFGTELKGGGIHLTAPAFAGIALAVLAIFCLLTYGTSRIANRLKFRTAPVWMLLIVIFGFTGASLEQAIGKSWKSRRSWMQEYMEFDLQLSPVRPPNGLAKFTAEFREHTWQETTPSLDLSQRPDIFLVFIESFRQDALRPDVTPFFYQFAQDEAQAIGHTWAASNGTHLSWFSTFTSQVATAREASRDLARDNNWPGLGAFHLLHDAGYDLQVHTAKSLDFRDMGCHFFGSAPFSILRQDAPGDPIHGLPTTERENILFSDLADQLESQPSGAHFTIATIDSTHYKYSWHDSFDPPFKEYYPHAFFPSTPTKEETRLIKNQYFNALAWGDHLAEQFCQNLKKYGKYDDSIIIFMGDHGEEFQDHGGWLHVSSLENEQVQSPMLIKWPKSFGRGPAHTEASNLDLLPTLLDYLGADPTTLDTAGRSLLSTSDPATSIITTAQGGVTKEAMLLTRGGYKAFFTWPHYFDGRPGTNLTLTRFLGPDGEIECDSPSAFLDALHTHFPDAFQRFFTHFEAVSPTSR